MGCRVSNKVELKAVAPNFTLKDHIYDVLLDAILKMDIYSDDADLRLDERNLAEQLAISRTPVREALARLEQDGFVTIQPRKGVFVRRKTRDEVLEMIVVWAALESMAARLAAENASDAELQALRALALKYSVSEAGAQISEYSDDNIRFHQFILQISQCALLKTMSDDLFLHMHSVRQRAMREDDRASRSVVDHIGIVEALESRDKELAAERVREHTMRLHDHVGRTWRRMESNQKLSTPNTAAPSNGAAH